MPHTMASNTPVTDAERDRITLLHSQGKSCNAIAHDIGRAPSTVSKIARQMGLEFNADRTKPATDNRKASNRAKRAALESRLLDEAGLLLDQMHGEHLVFNFGGKDNTYEEHTLPEPDVQSKRTLIQAVGVAVDRALKLAEADKAADGAEAGKSMVGALFAALAVTPVEDQEPARDA